MRFLTSPGFIPLILLLLFGGAYLIYLGLVFYRARKLRTSPKGVIYKLLIRCLVFLLLLISFLGPLVKQEETLLQTPLEKQIYLAFDLTTPMAEKDIQPSRLQRSVHVARQIVDNAPANCKFGILTFSSIPYVYSPLTSDKDAIRDLLESIHEDLLVNIRSDKGEALLLVGEKFKGKDKTSQKLLVIFSNDPSYPDSSFIYDTDLFPVFHAQAGNTEKTADPSYPVFKIEKESQVKLLLHEINNTKSGISEEILSGYSENVYYYFLVPALFLLLIDGLITVNILKL